MFRFFTAQQLLYGVRYVCIYASLSVCVRARARISTQGFYIMNGVIWRFL